MKQGVVNVIQLPLNDDFKAVSIAVSRLLYEGWEWRGISKSGIPPVETFYIELGRTFEYVPEELGMVETHSPTKERNGR